MAIKANDQHALDELAHLIHEHSRDSLADVV